VSISFLANFISFTHGIYFILPQHSFHSLAACISFSQGIYFICSKFYLIHSQHLFHSPMAFISFVTTFISFSHGIYFICVDFYVILSWHLHHAKIRKKIERNRGWLLMMFGGVQGPVNISKYGKYSCAKWKIGKKKKKIGDCWWWCWRFRVQCTIPNMENIAVLNEK